MRVCGSGEGRSCMSERRVSTSLPVLLLPGGAHRAVSDNIIGKGFEVVPGKRVGVP